MMIRMCTVDRGVGVETCHIGCDAALHATKGRFSLPMQTWTRLQIKKSRWMM